MTLPSVLLIRSTSAKLSKIGVLQQIEKFLAAVFVHLTTQPLPSPPATSSASSEAAHAPASPSPSPAVPLPAATGTASSGAALSPHAAAPQTPTQSLPPASSAQPAPTRATALLSDVSSALLSMGLARTKLSSTLKVLEYYLCSERETEVAPLSMKVLPTLQRIVSIKKSQCLAARSLLCCLPLTHLLLSIIDSSSSKGGKLLAWGRSMTFGKLGLGPEAERKYVLHSRFAVARTRKAHF
jgi:hypothetical protein